MRLKTGTTSFIISSASYARMDKTGKVNRDAVLATCITIVDTLQSIIEKLKLFPIPLKLAKHKESIAKLPNWNITAAIRQLLGLAMTILYATESIEHVQQDLTKKQAQSWKVISNSFEDLKSFVNRTLDKLTAMLPKHPCFHNDYIIRFSKKVDKLQKKLDQCTKELSPIIETAGLPALSKTMQHLKQLYPSEEQIPDESSNIAEMFVVLKQHVIDLARAKTMVALEGKNVRPSRDPPVHKPTISPKTTFDRRNAVIENIMNSPRIKVEPKKTLAEQQGFVPRTEKTRREPNWNLDKDLPPAPSNKDTASPPSGSLQDSPSPYRPGEDWPLIRPDLTQSGRESPLQASHPSAPIAGSILDDVYDSYHDHVPDAVLGLPGTPVERQPSHKRPVKTSPTRVRPSGTPPPVPPRNDAARQAAALAARQEGEQKTAVEQPSTPDRMTKQDSATSSASKYAALPMDEIRDQYY